MKRESTAMPVTQDAVDVAGDHRSTTDVVRCGAELVGLSERFYGAIFVGAIISVSLAGLAALLLLPLRGTALPGGHLTPAVLTIGLIIAATPLTIRRAQALYRLLRRRPSAQLVLVLVAALLVVHPFRSQLWWPSCTILMLLAVVAPRRRVLAYGLVVLAANLVSHVVTHNLTGQASGLIGLWIGYPFWTAIISIVTDRLAGHILRLNAATAPLRQPPRHVNAWKTDPPANPAPTVQRPDPVTSDRAVLVRSSDPRLPRDVTRTDDDRDATSTPQTRRSDGALEKLTARQLQVVALLADGLRYREVAACLCISTRQVQRHVAQAVARLGVHNAYELVMLAASTGMVPRPQNPDHGRFDANAQTGSS